MVRYRLRLMAVIVLVLAAWALPAIAEEPPQQALAWQVGPGEAKLGDQAVLKLPKGYRLSLIHI